MALHPRSRRAGAGRTSGRRRRTSSGAGTLLDPEALTIGFARRFATYKRADLIFRDIERLRRLLVNPRRPVQIVFAGKAHPADEPGKKMLQEVYSYTRDPRLEGRVAFLEDYDLHLAHRLVQGVDLWLNLPRVAARGVRHQRDEGGAERGAAAEHARRLVGRGVRRRQRLGDAAGAARTAMATPPTPRACTTCWRTRSCRCSTTGTTQPSPRMDPPDEAGAPGGGPAVHSAPDGAEYVREYYVPAAAGPSAGDEPPTA